MRMITRSRLKSMAGSRLVRELKARGWVISIGHTRAELKVLDDACEAGARHMTHFMNAMAPWHHRTPGPIAWGLSRDDVTFDLIADGIDLDPFMLRLLSKMKGANGNSSISDAIAAAERAMVSIRTGAKRWRLKMVEIQRCGQYCRVGDQHARRRAPHADARSFLRRPRSHGFNESGETARARSRMRRDRSRQAADMVALGADGRVRLPIFVVGLPSHLAHELHGFTDERQRTTQVVACL